MKGNDKTTIIVAMIGGACAIVAALIGLFNPVVTKLADRVLTAPTITTVPTATATFPLPVATSTAPPAASSTPVSRPPSTNPATRLPTYSAPQGAAIHFILANNDIQSDAFFIDGAFVTNIASGQVLVFDVTPGTHHLEYCPVDENPVANSDDCDSKSYAVTENPFDWTLGNEAKAVQKVTLVLMNVSNTPTDIYMDGTMEDALDANQFYILTAPRGTRKFQNCPTGVTPDQAGSTCTDAVDQDLQAAVEFWKVGN